MKRKEESPKIYISADDLKELEEKYPRVFNKLVEQQNGYKRKRKEPKLYISTEDIEELHEKYAPIFKRLNIDYDCGLDYIQVIHETALNTLNREIEELSQARKLDIEVTKAQIEAKNDEQIPRYTHPLRRLFLKTPNRAMANILDNAELEANELHSRAEYENDVNAVLIERELAELSSSEELPKECRNMSRRKLSKLRARYEKLSALLSADKKLSKRKLSKLRARYEKLSALFAPKPEESTEQADKPEQEEPEQNGSTPGANVQSEQATQSADETSEQLPKRRRRKPKPEESSAEQSEQLPGQVAIEEVENDE